MWTDIKNKNGNVELEIFYCIFEACESANTKKGQSHPYLFLSYFMDCGLSNQTASSYIRHLSEVRMGPTIQT